jgi:hypothetical protein
MKSIENKIIVYDSNCKVCSSLRQLVLKCTSIPETKIKALKDLPEELLVRVDPDQFKNVMALIDITGTPTVYGGEGIAFIFSSQYKTIDWLLSFKPVFNIFNYLYKVQAYNRYVIATPRSKFVCDCFPERVISYRITYILLCLLISILLTAMFGVSLKGFFPRIDSFTAAGQMVLIAGTGWVLQILFAAGVIRGKALDYVGHLSTIMVVGLLILLPWMLLHFITGSLNIYGPLISVAASSLCMLVLHFQRTKHLELSQLWSLSWFFFLQGTAYFWVNFFHHNLFI